MSRAVIAEKATHAGERAREMLERAPSVVSRARSLVSGDAQFFSAQPKLDVIRKQLENDSLQEKKDGMKRVIAQICKGQDMSSLFADVVKNILLPSIELRKLIYFYIVHYAEERPNEALLSISAFQRDLLDSSMHVRSLALRMLSSIRIPAIQQVVMVAIRKCASDMSPIVRKTAAISLAQMYTISGDSTDKDMMIPFLGQFLGDRSPEVIAAAALSLMEIASDRLDLLHRHFRKICRQLVECDEWGQTILMHVLLRYARTQFLDPNRSATQPKEDAKRAQGSDSDSDDSSERNMGLGPNAQLQQDLLVDPDHRLLLSSVKPLLASMNSAVVIGAASLYFHTASTADLDLCVRPLLRLLGGPSEGHAVTLSAIHTFVLSRPQPFIPHIKEFFINSDDTTDVRQLKIRIISKLTTAANFTPVIHEFRSYLRSFDVQKVKAALFGLGLVSSAVADSATQIMRLISPLLSHRNSEVATDAVVVLRQLVVQGTDKAQTSKLVHRLLVQVLKNEIRVPVAKASILWLVGENIPLHPAIAQSAPDCFRVFVKNFANEDPQVKKQLVMLGSKIWLHLEGEGALADRFRKLFFYVLELVKYDPSYEVRDLGRIIESTVDRQSSTFQSVKAALLGNKPVPQQNDPFLERAKYQLGSLSHLFGNALLGYTELPPWPTAAPDATVRDPPADTKSPSESTRSEYSDETEEDSEATSTNSTEAGSPSSASGTATESDESDSDSDSDSDSESSGSRHAVSSPMGKKKKSAPEPPVAAKAKLVISRVQPKPTPVAVEPTDVPLEPKQASVPSPPAAKPEPKVHQDPNESPAKPPGDAEPPKAEEEEQTEQERTEDEQE